MNAVVLRGRLTDNPELRDVNDTVVANFVLAVRRPIKKADGSRTESTDFIPCEAWDSGARSIGNLLKKGHPVLVQGSIKQHEWEQDGQKRSRLKVRVQSFEPDSLVFKEKKQAEEMEEKQPQPVAVSSDNNGEDIPF